jgi:AbrB family looped-hinge helix DNA binding protein
MQTVATTRLSSKGQVVIPEEVRERLGLEAGAQFVVVGEGDVVILKVITPPSKKEFSELLGKARSQARKAGLRKADIAKAVRKARSRR